MKAVVETAREAAKSHPLKAEILEALDAANRELADIEWAAQRLDKATITFPPLAQGASYADGARVLAIIERIATGQMSDGPECKACNDTGMVPVLFEEPREIFADKACPACFGKAPAPAKAP